MDGSPAATQYVYYLLRVDESLLLAVVLALRARREVDRETDQFVRTVLPQLAASMRATWVAEPRA